VLFQLCDQPRTADWLTWVSRATAVNELVSVTRTNARSGAIRSIIPSVYAKMRRDH
jgi:hypothetical protein